MAQKLLHGGGGPVAGFSVGVLCLNTRHALLPGNVQHAATFAFPVVYEIVPVDDPWQLMNGDPQLAEVIADRAKALQQRGVSAIAGACGSFGYYQKTVVAQLDVPAVLSIMCQVPHLLQMLAPTKKLGVICASESALNARLYAQCDIANPDRLVVRQMLGNPNFDLMLRAEPYDPTALERECIHVAQNALAEDPSIGAFLLQCSDLPPFSPAIQRATRRPVFDMTLLIRQLAGAAQHLHAMRN